MEEEKRQQDKQETETYTDSTPVVVQDGSCEHYYEFIGVDPEGKGEAQCKNCWQGRYFNVETEEVKDGTIQPK